MEQDSWVDVEAKVEKAGEDNSKVLNVCDGSRVCPC